MTINYKWYIPHADVRTSTHNGLEKVITGCEWRVTASEEWVDSANMPVTLTAESYGYTEFPNVYAESFIEFAEVNQAIVLEWVWKDVVKEDVERALSVQIENAKTPPVEKTSIPA
jgi:hypothetical protein